MKRFEFKLQTLLEIREAKEKTIQNELSKLIGIQNQERIKQDDYRGRITEEQRKFSIKVKEGLHFYAEALMYERFIDFANLVIGNAQDKIDSMEPEIQKVREKLIEASKEKKVIDKLKEKRWDEYLYEQNREIGKENDDMNQKLFSKKRLQQI